MNSSIVQVSPLRHFRIVRKLCLEDVTSGETLRTGESALFLHKSQTKPGLSSCHLVLIPQSEDSKRHARRSTVKSVDYKPQLEKPLILGTVNAYPRTHSTIYLSLKDFIGYDKSKFRIRFYDPKSNIFNTLPDNKTDWVSVDSKEDQLSLGVTFSPRLEHIGQHTFDYCLSCCGQDCTNFTVIVHPPPTEKREKEIRADRGTPICICDDIHLINMTKKISLGMELVTDSDLPHELRSNPYELCFVTDLKSKSILLRGDKTPNYSEYTIFLKLNDAPDLLLYQKTKYHLLLSRQARYKSMSVVSAMEQLREAFGKMTRENPNKFYIYRMNRIPKSRTDEGDDESPATTDAEFDVEMIYLPVRDGPVEENKILLSAGISGLKTIQLEIVKTLCDTNNIDNVLDRVDKLKFLDQFNVIALQKSQIPDSVCSILDNYRNRTLKPSRKSHNDSSCCNSCLIK
ncbi:hypothetical protein Ciccas_006692 [Cichlidogyrus casuarinus]|uniref:CABIT domain-containing protein n=1 Tax=Cichlidogyrus casuarinus TaxID=1844966 RepID=A0ABD2Q509_9PLAT